MPGKDMKIDPPYDEDLSGILAFSSFADAERTIRRLEILCHKYRAASDKKGVDYCRHIALMGRRRAEFISRNPRVCLKKRLQKREVATWFGIWLESPTIFEEWLALRKGTDEYKKLLSRISNQVLSPSDAEGSEYKGRATELGRRTRQHVEKPDSLQRRRHVRVRRNLAKNSRSLSEN